MNAEEGDSNRKRSQQTLAPRHPGQAHPAVASRKPEAESQVLHLYSYSNACTSEPLTADSAGQMAARNAAPRITGTSISAIPNG